MQLTIEVVRCELRGGPSLKYRTTQEPDRGGWNGSSETDGKMHVFVSVSFRSMSHLPALASPPRCVIPAAACQEVDLTARK